MTEQTLCWFGLIKGILSAFTVNWSQPQFTLPKQHQQQQQIELDALQDVVKLFQRRQRQHQLRRLEIRDEDREV